MELGVHHLLPTEQSHRHYQDGEDSRDSVRALSISSIHPRRTSSQGETRSAAGGLWDADTEGRLMSEKQCPHRRISKQLFPGELWGTP